MPIIKITAANSSVGNHQLASTNELQNILIFPQPPSYFPKIVSYYWTFPGSIVVSITHFADRS
jgi:hypothetical protein